MRLLLYQLHTFQTKSICKVFLILTSIFLNIDIFFSFWNMYIAWFILLIIYSVLRSSLLPYLPDHCTRSLTWFRSLRLQTRTLVFALFTLGCVHKNKTTTTTVTNLFCAGLFANKHRANLCRTKKRKIILSRKLSETSLCGSGRRIRHE